MTNVVLKDVVKRFKGVTALKGISFDIGDGEFFVLLGPTGAGKTTTLRLIAGLEILDSGDILFDGHSILSLSPAERDVAFVFQQYSLYPMLNVYDNLASPLRSPMRKVPEDEIKRIIDNVAEKLHISHLLDRKSSVLSGGEMQRVAIGRAIVRCPRLFLMDEPLSNLDAKLREELRIELKYLQKTQGSTTLFVTHDQIEAMTMADRVAVLNEGEILQIGTPEDIYDRPATTFVAQLVGTPRINLVPAVIEDGSVCLKGSSLKLPLPQLTNLPYEFMVGIRPEDIQLVEDGKYAGEVTLLEPLGVETILHIRVGDVTLLSVESGLSKRVIGENVSFNVKVQRISYFDREGLRITT